MKYTKTFDFGKIAYNGQKAKTNLVELELNLVIEGKKAIFTAMGRVWNSKHSNYITCGQMIDDVFNEFANQLKNPTLYKEIMQLWEKWHLKDMHTGCLHQRKFENEPYEKHKKAYCKKCNYVYGSAWNYEAIVRNDLLKICQLLDIDAQTTRRIIS